MSLCSHQPLRLSFSDTFVPFSASLPGHGLTHGQDALTLMFIIYGMYRWARKRVAYRNDFCLTCEGQRVAEQYRTFNCGHLFFIPVLPLGFHKRWHCSMCGNNPHERVRTSRTLLILFAVVVGLFTALLWLGGSVPPEEAALIWGMRLVFTASFVGLIYWIRRSKPAVGLRDHLAQVPPLPLDQCLYCRGPLDPEGSCAPCGVRRLQLGSTG